MTVIPILGGNDDALNNAATEYNGLQGGTTWYITESYKRQTISVAGTINNLYIKLSAVPGGSGSFRFSLFVNGVENINTRVDIGSAATTGFVIYDVAIAAGDEISLCCAPISSPTATTSTAKWYAEFTPTTANETPFMGGSNAGATPSTGTQYNYVAYGDIVFSATENNRKLVIPSGGTIKNLYVKLRTAPGGVGKGYTVTLVQNGTPTTLVATLSNVTSGNDTTHTVTVLAGDLLDVSFAVIGAPATGPATWGMTFVPTTSGTFAVMTACSTDTPTNTEISNFTGYSVYDGSANHGALVPDITLSAIYVDMATAPGSGQSRTSTVRDDNVSTSCVVTISDTAIVGNTTGLSVSVVTGSILNIRHTTSASPTSTTLVKVGVLASKTSSATTTTSTTSTTSTSTSTTSLASTTTHTSSTSTTSTSTSSSTSTSTSTTAPPGSILMSESFEGSVQYTSTNNTDATHITITTNDTTYPYKGIYNLKIVNTGAAVTNQYGNIYKTISAEDVWIAVHNVRVTALPSTSGEYRFITGSEDAGGGTSIFNFGIYNDGGVVKWFEEHRNDSGAGEVSVINYSTSSPAIAINRNYQILLHMSRSASVGEFEVWVGSEGLGKWKIVNLSSLNNDGRAFNCLSFGFSYSDLPNPVTLYMDRIIIANSEISLDRWEGGNIDGADGWLFSSKNGVALKDIESINGIGRLGVLPPVATTTTSTSTTSTSTTATPTTGIVTTTSTPTTTNTPTTTTSPPSGSLELTDHTFATEGGQGTNLTKVTTNHFAFDLQMDSGNARHWWMFEVTGNAGGKTVIYDIDYYSSLQEHTSVGPAYSFDNGTTWTYVPLIVGSATHDTWLNDVYYTNDGHDILRFRITFPTGQNTALVALAIPWTYTQNVALAATFPKAGIGSVNSYASAGGTRNVYVYTIDNDSPAGKDTVWMIANQEGGEKWASWITVGMLDFLCSDDADAITLRSEHNWKIMPMMNPDGCYLGYSEFNASGVDLTIEWGKVAGGTATAEVQGCYNAMVAWEAAGHPIDVFISMHCWMIAPSWLILSNPNTNPPFASTALQTSLITAVDTYTKYGEEGKSTSTSSTKEWSRVPYIFNCSTVLLEASQWKGYIEENPTQVVGTIANLKAEGVKLAKALKGFNP
jgi:hypothetical protein